MTMVLGPYAAYVWSAYAISFGAIAVTVVVTLNAWRKAKHAVEQRSVQGSETNS